jgi:hypothetical protein
MVAAPPPTKLAVYFLAFLQMNALEQKLRSVDHDLAYALDSLGLPHHQLLPDRWIAAQPTALASGASSVSLVRTR